MAIRFEAQRSLSEVRKSLSIVLHAADSLGFRKLLATDDLKARAATGGVQSE